MQNMKEYEVKSQVLKAMAHPIRVCMVRNLLKNQCNVTTMQECLDIPQSTISQHLAKLKAAGIVEGQRKGLEICYKVVNDEAKALIQTLFKE